jgi:hypothetical protein
MGLDEQSYQTMGTHFWTQTGKERILGPFAKILKDLLKFNRDQLRWLVGRFTGHCYLKGYLFKLRLTDDPKCERSLEEDESATHVLWDSEAIAYLWFLTCASFSWNRVTIMTPP